MYSFNPFFEPTRAALAFVVLSHLIDYTVGVDFGKQCDHDDDCHDFRLVCRNYSCVCSRFFDRDSHRNVCELNMTDLNHFLASLGEERDYREELDAEARSTFNQLGFAGILALSLGILGASCCVFVFCIIDSARGAKLGHFVAYIERIILESEGLSDCTMVKPSLQILTETHEPWLLSRFKDYQEKQCDPEYKYPEHLPHVIRFGYSMGHVLNDLCASMWFTYSLVFYTAVIGVSHTMAGVIMVIGQVTDALSTPIIGALSDRGSSTSCEDPKCGNRKNWYIIGTILIVISKPFMFSPCLICTQTSTDITKVAYFSLFIVIFQIGWAAVQTVHLAMAVDITPYEKERTFILALRNTMTAICNSATYVGQWLTIMFSGDEMRQINKDDIGRFQVIVGAIIIVGIVTSIIFLVITPKGTARIKRNVKYREHLIMKPSPTKKSNSSSSGIKDILSQWKLHYIGFIFMKSRIFVVAVQALLTLYLHETLGALTYELATVPLLLNTVCFIASLAVGPLNELFGHKVTFVIGALSGFGASLWTYFGTGHMERQALMYFAAVFYGTACALMQVTAMALVAIYIGEDICNGAFIYGYMSFLDKISTGFTLALILHFRPTDNKNFFTVAVSYTCGISCILGLVALLMLSSPLKDNQASQSEPRSKDLQEYK